MCCIECFFILTSLLCDVCCWIVILFSLEITNPADVTYLYIWELGILLPMAVFCLHLGFVKSYEAALVAQSDVTESRQADQCLFIFCVCVCVCVCVHWHFAIFVFVFGVFVCSHPFTFCFVHE